MKQNNFITWIENVINTFFDLIFPKEKTVLELESMNKQDFELATKKQDKKGLNAKFTARVINSAGETYSLFEYRNRYVRTAIWLLKYKGNKKIAALFALFLQDFLLNLPVSEKNTSFFIVPIPISKERRKERGFNQIELVLKELTPLPGFSIKIDLLVKNKNTPPQTSFKGRKDRLKNLEGCFSVTSEVGLAGATIILLDDVLTTGSTLAEARRTLFVSGAHEVIAVTLAH